MSRKNSFAGVYMFLNVYTKKVYIGESRNILRRLVDHRCTSNSIIHQIGVNNFVPIVLESEFTDPKLKDPEYRSKREAYYIKKYRATDPEYGYNCWPKQIHTKKSKNDMLYNESFLMCGKVNKPKSKKSRIKQSTPILMYDTLDDSVVMFWGKRSCGDVINSDRGTVARATIHGKKHRHFYFYEVDGARRLAQVREVYNYKMNADDSNNLSLKSLKEYMKGLKHVNKFCKKWELPVIDLSEFK